MARGYALEKTGSYCNGYNADKDTYKLRTLEACEAHIRKELPTAKYFFFRTDNSHCAPCPTSFTGKDTQYKASTTATTYALSS
jgi:hypothetical protein